MLVEEPDDVGRRRFGAPLEKSVTQACDDGQVMIIVDAIAEIRAPPARGWALSSCRRARVFLPGR